MDAGKDSLDWRASLEDVSKDNPTITDLMRELSELDQSQWADKTIGYEVRR